MSRSESDSREHGAEAPRAGVGLPVRFDMRRALDIYVSGRNRTLGPAQKSESVSGEPAVPFARPSEWPIVPASGRVTVPPRLQFHRNAGKWRGTAPSPDRSN